MFSNKSTYLLFSQLHDPWQLPEQPLHPEQHFPSFLLL